MLVWVVRPDRKVTRDGPSSQACTALGRQLDLHRVAGIGFAKRDDFVGSVLQPQVFLLWGAAR